VVKNNLEDAQLRIGSLYDSLKPAEKKVADFILKNVPLVIRYSITRVAEEAGVSEATVVKFCQRLGYSGYQEFKITLAQNRKEAEVEEIYDAIAPNDDSKTIINKIFQLYERSFADTKKLISGANLEQCVKMLRGAQRIYFFGFGASAIVARDAEQKFNRINYFSRALVESHSQQTTAALLGPEDLVVAISHSGRTTDLIKSLDIVRENGTPVIAITSNLKSPVAEKADEVILFASRETPFRGSAMASRMAQLAAIDVLFLGVATSEFEKTTSALHRTRVVMSRTKI